MKKLIRQLFGAPAAKSSANRGRDSRDNPLTIQDGSDNALRRQLVQTLLRDLLRRHGIPTPWVDCQVLAVASRSRGEGVHVRLGIRHWDSRLLTYAWAFQTALAADIARFEPTAARWLHGISWQFEVSACPCPELPDAAIWAEKDEPLAASPAPLPIDTAGGQPSQADGDAELKQDLERMFAIRDAELVGQAILDKEKQGDFAQTEPAPLRS